MTNTFSKAVFSLFVVIILVTGMIGCTSAATTQPEATTRTVTDMAGRKVTVPANITRVVSSGSPQCVNSALMAMGKGKTIVNGLPQSAKNQAKYEYIFSPNIADGPSISYPTADIEAVLSLKPDVIFTSDKPTLTKLEESNVIPTIYVEFDDADEIKAALNLIGQVFNDIDRANITVQYFDNKTNEINAKISSIPLDKRPRVLYANMQTLTSFFNTSEWCIEKAGGIPVTANQANFVGNNYQFPFNMEQLIVWNPDIIIALNPSDISYINSHSEFSNIDAVKNNRVYVAPSCMGWFGGRSPEIPISVVWMASKFYPDMFSEAYMRTEITSFYKEFYGYELSDTQLDEILGGLQ
jgi:iron complex transport system substrate-binding protein